MRSVFRTIAEIYHRLRGSTKPFIWVPTTVVPLVVSYFVYRDP